MEKRFLTDSDIVQEIGEDGGSAEKVLSQKETQTQLSKKVDANFGVENTGKLLGIGEDGEVVPVDTADKVTEDDARPITAAAVYSTVGNIEILMGTI